MRAGRDTGRTNLTDLLTGLYFVTDVQVGIAAVNHVVICHSNTVSAVNRNRYAVSLILVFAVAVFIHSNDFAAHSCLYRCSLRCGNINCFVIVRCTCSRRSAPAKPAAIRNRTALNGIYHFVLALLILRHGRTAPRIALGRFLAICRLPQVSLLAIRQTGHQLNGLRDFLVLSVAAIRIDKRKRRLEQCIGARLDTGLLRHISLGLPAGKLLARADCLLILVAVCPQLALFAVVQRFVIAVVRQRLLILRNVEYIILCRVVVSVHEYGFLFIRQVRVAVQNISHICGMIRASALEFRFIRRYIRLKPHIIACIYLALNLIVPRLTRLFAHGGNEQVIRKGLLLAVRQAAVLLNRIQYHPACLVRRVQLLAVFVRALGQFLQRIVVLGKRAYCKAGVCRLVSCALHLLAYLGADLERSPV